MADAFVWLMETLRKQDCISQQCKRKQKQLVPYSRGQVVSRSPLWRRTAYERAPAYLALVLDLALCCTSQRIFHKSPDYV